MLPPLPKLHVVTDDSVLTRPHFVDEAVEILESRASGVALHVRGPRTSGRRIFELTAAIAERAGVSALWVNDRVDVARAVGTAVHLGARSMSVTAVRELVPTVRVGRSIRQSPDEGDGADYLFAGPVFATPSHADVPGQGVPWLAHLSGLTELPLVAIGGISPARIGVLLGAGVHGCAVIRAVWDAPNRLRAVDELCDALYTGGSSLSEVDDPT